MAARHRFPNLTSIICPVYSRIHSAGYVLLRRGMSFHTANTQSSIVAASSKCLPVAPFPSNDRFSCSIDG